MPRVRSRTLWLLLAPAALLAVAWWQRGYTLRPSGHPTDRDAQAIAASSRMPPSHLRSRREQGRDGTIAIGLPLNVRAGLDTDADLYHYAQQLATRAASGDADAGWMLSRVYDYCAGYALDPVGYQQDSQWIETQQAAGLVTMLASRARLAERCAGFTPQDGLSAPQLSAQRALAAQAGSLAAEAALLAAGQPLDSSTAYKSDLVERVLASRDPEAYLALSPAMGARASGDAAYSDRVAGDQYAELAWQVAACRLGLDCTAEGTLMTAYCANGGICSQNPAQDFESFVYDAAVSRQGASKMDALVTALVK